MPPSAPRLDFSRLLAALERRRTLYPNWEAAEAEREAARRAAEMRAQYRNTHFGPRYETFALETLAARNEYQRCGLAALREQQADLVAGAELGLDPAHAQWLFFTGPVGCGKTTLLAAGFRSFALNGWKCRAFRAAEFVESVLAARRKLSEESATPEATIKKLVGAATLLQLDEFGVGMDDRWPEKANDQTAVLLTLFDWAYNRGRPAIHLASNLSAKKIAELVDGGPDGRFARRAREVGRIVA